MADEIDENFSSFLVSQASSLTALNIKGIEKVPSLIYSTIISDLEQLSKLSIEISSLPTDRVFYDELKPNLSLKNLWLHKKISNDKAVKRFLQNCPNIVKLVLNEDITYCINFIAAFNKKLIDLSFKSITTPVTDTQFKNLKNLTIDSIESSKAWMTLVENCTSIEIFTVKFVDQETFVKNEIEFLLQQPTLRHLKFTGDYKDVKIIFDLIKTNFGNLKTLELSMMESSEYGSTGTAVVNFQFPSDFLKWNVNAADKKFSDAWTNRS